MKTNGVTVAIQAPLSWGWLSCVNALSGSSWHMYLIFSLTCSGLQRVQVRMDMTPLCFAYSQSPLSKEELLHGESCPLGAYTWASHWGWAGRGGHCCWALPAPGARRGCDPVVSLDMELKTSEPEVAVLGWREVFCQTAAKFLAATNRRSSRWECCSRHILARAL